MPAPGGSAFSQVRPQQRAGDAASQPQLEPELEPELSPELGPEPELCVLQPDSPHASAVAASATAIAAKAKRQPGATSPPLRASLRSSFFLSDSDEEGYDYDYHYDEHGDLDGASALGRGSCAGESDGAHTPPKARAQSCQDSLRDSTGRALSGSGDGMRGRCNATLGMPPLRMHCAEASGSTARRALEWPDTLADACPRGMAVHASPVCLPSHHYRALHSPRRPTATRRSAREPSHCLAPSPLAWGRSPVPSVRRQW